MHFPLNLSDYDYPLPAARIAQNPAMPRDACRLLILDRNNGAIRHDTFCNIGNYLNENDLLVLNNSRVMPARVFGKKKTGGKVEFLFLHELEKNVWECLVRPGRRLPSGTVVSLNGNGIIGEIVSRRENGIRLMKFSGIGDIREKLPELGIVPFPPYVTKATCSAEEYQTVYAKQEGSVAAPTAGLHFTDTLLQELKSRGVSFSEITLHVGWGTFRPVRSENIQKHKMEKEWFHVPQTEADTINGAKLRKKKIVAVGTTACRVLESFRDDPVRGESGWTDLFIYPGFSFSRVDALITNFHLPKSTLLMLVCAFAGKERIMKAYEEAVRVNYRFYSFGDAMLIL